MQTKQNIKLGFDMILSVPLRNLVGAPAPGTVYPMLPMTYIIIIDILDSLAHAKIKRAKTYVYNAVQGRFVRKFFNVKNYCMK